jgi:hypothetical protein
MIRRFYLIVLVVVTATACNNNAVKKVAETPTDSQTVKQEAIVSAVDDAIAKNAAIKQIDALEKLFDNQNYLRIEGKDSSYIYFSRLGKTNFYTHSYIMQKGDSANVTIDAIQVNASNKVQWHWQGKQLVLASTTDFSSTWIADTKDTVLFQKIDDNTLQLVANGKKNSLHKTPTLSMFLVRSYYDYTHGTHLAFDNINFTKKQ